MHDDISTLLICCSANNKKTILVGDSCKFVTQAASVDVETGHFGLLFLPLFLLLLFLFKNCVQYAVPCQVKKREKRKQLRQVQGKAALFM